MSQQGAAVVEAPPEEEVRRREEPAGQKPKRLPPHAVVLFNDEQHTFAYVIETLMKVFGYSQEKSYQLTLQIHNAGRGIVWSGAKEVAELKCEQIRSAGPDFYAEKKVDFPLRATVEPLPG
jgi:ATP-dependent Clp protease adaptor protein ClpS